MVIFETNMGNFSLELNAEKAPNTVANFLSYVNKGHYDGTIFHRVIPNFMIQGGGFEPGMTQKPTDDTIENEANNGLSNKLGSVAMARTNDPHSASSQFFINIKDNNFLDFSGENSQGWGYCVFGEIVEGQDVIDAIKVVKTGNAAGHQDVPLEDVVVTKAYVSEQD